MKKILSFLSLVLVALTFVSCNSNSPEAVVQEYVADLQTGKYEEAIDLFYFKWGKEIEKKGGITGVEITNVSVAEDGNSANVKYILKYGDGTSKDQDSKLLKVDEQWKMESGK